MLSPSQINIFGKLSTRYMKRTLEKDTKASGSGSCEFALLKFP